MGVRQLLLCVANSGTGKTGVCCSRKFLTISGGKKKRLPVVKPVRSEKISFASLEAKWVAAGCAPLGVF